MRDPLKVGEKVLVLAECLRKKDTPARLYKSTTENKSFVNRGRTFIISERSKLIISIGLKKTVKKKKKKILKARTTYVEKYIC